MLMTVLAGKTLVDMLVRSKYWTELIDKGNTGQLWNVVVVVFVKVIEKLVARLAPRDTSEGIPLNKLKITDSDLGISQEFRPNSIRNGISCNLSNPGHQTTH